MSSKSFRRSGVLIPLLCIALLPGCAIVDYVKGGDDYESAGSIGRLEAPPELVTPEWDESLQLPQTANERVSALETYGKAIDAAVAPEYVDIQVRREGDLRWLEAEVDPVNLWPLLRGFWSERGVTIEKDEPALGIMETEWIEDINSESDPDSEGRRVAATRTKYRIRLEREPNAVTNIFLTQRRSELQSISDQGGVWTEITSDPEEEAEMNISLMEYVGQSREEARLNFANAEGPRLYLDLKDVGGVPVLLVGDVYSRVWRRTGVALDRAGLSVFDQDRDKGVYLIDVSDLSLPDELPQLSHDRYQIHLLSQSGQTLITAHSGYETDGVIPAEEAKLLLKQILSAYQVFRTTS